MTNISLRDYFAGQALAGMIMSPEFLKGGDTLVKNAFKIADAMVKTSEKKD